MSNPEPDHGAEAEDGRQYARYELPGRLTASGRRAVEKAVPDLLADLAAIMDRNTHHAVELTDRDVEAGLNALGRGRLRAVPPPPGSAATRRNTVGPVLAAVGTTGTTVTSPFLHSPLQIAVFAVLVLIGLTGLVLAWLRPTRADVEPDRLTGVVVVYRCSTSPVVTCTNRARTIVVGRRRQARLVNVVAPELHPANINQQRRAVPRHTTRRPPSGTASRRSPTTRRCLARAALRGPAGCPGPVHPGMRCDPGSAGP